MKHNKSRFGNKLQAAFIAAAMVLGTFCNADAQKLVIVGTNDTHSQIDPTDDDNMGGVLRRKVLVDSIRQANPNVLLVDMGDPVQGTMYFNLYGGEVENMVMNDLGYDIRILGNHDFDNGVDELLRNIRNSNSEFVSTNYRFADPELASLFRPYLIKEVDGKRVAFIGINLQPKGMISEGNYDGVEYLDAMKAANATAWHLRHNEGVDKVVALTHIGYAPSGTGTSDTELAGASEDIDLILGGHSHTLVDPRNPQKSVAWHLPSADSDSVAVTQAGKAGKYVAVVELDLGTNDISYEVIPVDSRLDAGVDPVLDAKIEPYREGVRRVMEKPVGKTGAAFEKDSDELLNLVADFIRDRGNELYDESVDFAIINKGGIRRGLPKGTVTQGQIQSMLPFNNKVVVLELTGKDILDTYAVMTLTDGNGISSEARVNYDPQTKTITAATVGGVDIDPDKTYTVATIDYLANGGDYMSPLTRGNKVAGSPDKVYDDLLFMLTEGKYKNRTLRPDKTKRFTAK